jgi:site-specific recombinase XerD
MAYSVTIVHWTYKKNASGIYPLKILVTVDKKPYFLHTPHKVTVQQWDNSLRQVKDHVNARHMNADLRRLVAEKEAEILIAARAGERITPEVVKGKKRDGSFLNFAQDIAKKVVDKEGKERVDIRVTKELNRIIAYKGAGVLLGDIDVAWLRKYDDHEKRRGIAQNTRNTTFKWLRNVMKRAAAEKLIRENPFDDFDIPAYVQGDTTYLVEEEKQALIKLLDKLPAGGLRTTLTYFLFACYAGPRHSDWHKFYEREMVYDGFLRLRPKKRSKGFVVMPVGKTLSWILGKIKELDDAPASNQKCNVHLKAIFAMAEVKINGKVIQGLRKDATTHVARHSFGYLCASQGLPKSTTAELMGISVQTVEVYYHLTGENIIKQAAALLNV